MKMTKVKIFLIKRILKVIRISYIQCIIIAVIPVTFFLGNIFNVAAQESSVNKAGKCGDGVCDSFEQMNHKVCPQDCQFKNIAAAADNNVNSVYHFPIEYVKNSPFGFHPGNAKSYSYLKDLNVFWSREGMYVIWDWVDKERNGHYNFTRTAAPPKKKSSRSEKIINYDDEWMNVPSDVNVVVNVCPFRDGGEFYDENEPQVYQNFVKALVERYDGDNDVGCVLNYPDCYNPGDGQYPSKEVIKRFQKNPIKYWQVCNQVFDTCQNDCKENYAVSFSFAQEKTYKGVKEADKSASVLIAGDSAKHLYPAIFQQLKGKYIDIIDYHRFMTHNKYNPQEDFDYLKENLKNSGFDIAKLKFWITESGTYSGDPKPLHGRDLPYQSEKQQAIGLFKIYISAVVYGIEKVFWAWNIVEGFQYDCGIFDYTGLVYDGNIDKQGRPYCEGDPYDKGRGIKKLAYYTYKFMVEKLGGVDWNGGKIIHDSDNVYIYRFIKKENSVAVWIAWWDWWKEPDKKEREVILTLQNGTGEFIITGAVPDSESGQDINEENYHGFFRKEMLKVKDKILKFNLQYTPVYIE